MKQERGLGDLRRRGTSFSEPHSLFSYLRDRVCSILSSAREFCLAHGLRQRTCDVESDGIILNFRSDVTVVSRRKTPIDVRTRLL